jgi:predicted dehydrogenase
VKKINIGLIGCGLGSGALYGSFFDYLEKGKLVACMDVDKNRAQILQKQTGAAYLYTDLDEMLANDEIDAVIVVMPTRWLKQHRQVNTSFAKNRWLRRLKRPIE